MTEDDGLGPGPRGRPGLCADGGHGPHHAVFHCNGAHPGQRVEAIVLWPCVGQHAGVDHEGLGIQRDPRWEALKEAQEVRMF